METLLVPQAEVAALLPLPACIAAVRAALGELAGGGAIQPLRPVMWLPERIGALGMMPGYLPSIDTIGVKTISVFPGNAGTPYDSHQGTIMLFEGRNGRLKAVIDATEVTAIRTAAASAVATDLLARPDASVVAILGSGVQAGTHLAAMAEVRPIRRARVWSRSPEHARRFAAGERAVPVEVAATVAEAVAGADIVCTTTAARRPILAGTMLEPGMHLNAVGASIPGARELDGPAVARCRLFVDRRESTLHEAGDFLLAREEGLVDDDHILAEIGEVITGVAAGRGSDAEITLFKSVGLAVEDIAAGDVVYRNAQAAGAGIRLELGGARRG